MGLGRLDAVIAQQLVETFPVLVLSCRGGIEDQAWKSDFQGDVRFQAQDSFLEIHDPHQPQRGDHFPVFIPDTQDGLGVIDIVPLQQLRFQELEIPGTVKLLDPECGDRVLV